MFPLPTTQCNPLLSLTALFSRLLNPLSSPNIPALSKSISSDHILPSDSYQQQYRDNLAKIKPRFKAILYPELSFDLICYSVNEIKSKESCSILSSEAKEKIFQSKVYCFLCALAFYELDTRKLHESYVRLILASSLLRNNKRTSENGKTLLRTCVFCHRRRFFISKNWFSRAGGPKTCFGPNQRTNSYILL